MTTYLITGCNRGIGLECCRQLNERGDEVIATCRSSSEELDGLRIRVETGIDITSESSILNLKKNLSEIEIDVLIHNAGIAESSSLENLNTESIRRQFEVNALAPLCFTRAILSHLNKGSKVILITSRMGSIEDNSSGQRYGYRMSKAALNAASKSLSIDLKARGIAVGIFHPGWVQTGMTGYSGFLTPEESAQLLFERIQCLSVETTGQFFHANGAPLPW